MGLSECTAADVKSGKVSSNDFMAGNVKMTIAEAAKVVMAPQPGFEGVDLELLQEVVPSPMVEALLKLGKTCAALDSHVLRLEARCGNLDVQIGQLKQLFIAKRTPPPMERGMTFWPTGDPIPSRSQTDELEGDTYAFGTNALRFTKNKSGRELEPGEYFMGGQVDAALRHKVQVNDFFWLEL